MIEFFEKRFRPLQQFQYEIASESGKGTSTGMLPTELEQLIEVEQEYFCKEQQQYEKSSHRNCSKQY